MLSLKKVSLAEITYRKIDLEIEFAQVLFSIARNLFAYVNIFSIIIGFFVISNWITYYYIDMSVLLEYITLMK